MNVELLELAAATLDDLLPDVVFVGGATVELWITDPAAPPVRPTKDVDVVVEVTTRREFYEFEAQLRRRGFVENQDVICRWLHRDSGLILDAMPARADILGFENRWQAEAIPHAIERQLPSGAVIRAISPPFMLATKLEAFKGRGLQDFLGSRDFADIVVVALVDGRTELVDDVAAAPDDARRYLAAEAHQLLDTPRILDGLAGAMRPDRANQERVDAVVLPALRRIANQG